MALHNIPLETLEALSIEALEELKKDIEKTIVKKQDERLEQLKEEVRQMAERLGVPFETLLERLTRERSGKGRKSGAPKRKLPWRFRHPTDPDKGWTGRGLPPKWLQEWEASGRSREELRIG
ncbi:MAG: H-NS family nucleoid-associated regulatory protein [Hydrogenophilus thermoluteolus]